MADEKPSTAWILTIGNEILIGRIVNTNASWLGQKLTFSGFKVERIIVVPDDIDDITEELRRGIERARIIITTGGLGPTYDDRTVEAIAKATGRRLILDEQALRMIREFYSRRGLPLTEERRKMAMIPEGARPLPNPVGAAPGVFLEHNGTVIVALPGVPSEMKAIYEEYVAPALSEIAPNKSVVECSIIVEGVPESSLAPYIKAVAKRYPTAYVKSHPKGHETRNPVLDLRVLASGTTPREALDIARAVLSELRRSSVEAGGRVVSESCEGADD